MIHAFRNGFMISRSASFRVNPISSDRRSSRRAGSRRPITRLRRAAMNHRDIAAQVSTEVRVAPLHVR